LRRPKAARLVQRRVEIEHVDVTRRCTGASPTRGGITNGAQHAPSARPRIFSLSRVCPKSMSLSFLTSSDFRLNSTKATV
jgi:hypothetical protein